MKMENENFEKWFAGSKVVDAAGQPLPVFHGTGASVDENFSFNPRFIGQHACSEGYGFYFSSDYATAQGYEKASGATLECFLNIKKPLPLRQKRFTKAQLKKILKAAVELEIASSDGEIADFRNSFLSNYADTYSISFQAALREAAEMEWDGSDTAVDQIASIANAAGDKTLIARAVQKALGYDGIVANGYDDLGQGGGQIYIAWFPAQIKAVANSGAWETRRSVAFGGTLRAVDSEQARAFLASHSGTDAKAEKPDQAINKPAIVRENCQFGLF